MLSVIVAVYNVKDYFKQCISSILKVNIPIEVIIVHDEVKDNSFSGNEDFLQDKRVVILNRENAGLSVARNQGLEVAKGDYILFVDGDDYVLSTQLQKLYEKAMETYADIAIGNYQDEGVIPCIPIAKEAFISDGKTVLQKYHAVLYSMVWRYLFKRAFMIENGLRFEPIKYSEDVVFTPLALNAAKSVYYSNITFYYYRNVEGSLSHDYNERKIMDCVKAFQVMYKKSEKFDRACQKAVRKEANFCVASAIAYAYKHEMLDSLKKKQFDDVLEKIDAVSINWFLFKLIWKINKYISYQLLNIKY